MVNVYVKEIEEILRDDNVKRIITGGADTNCAKCKARIAVEHNVLLKNGGYDVRRVYLQDGWEFDEKHNAFLCCNCKDK